MKTRFVSSVQKLLGLVCALRAVIPTSASAPAESPTALQVLDRYEAAQRQTYGSFIARFESENEGYINQHTVLEPGRRKGRDVVEIRTDGRRYYWCEERSGQCFPALAQTTPATDPRVKWFLFDGRFCYRSGHEPLRMIQRAARPHESGERSGAYGGRLAVTISERFQQDSEFSSQFNIHGTQSHKELPDSLGTGGLFHEVGLIQRLRKAQTLELEPKQESVGGVPCYVVQASWTAPIDARGQRHIEEHIYRLHFDPAHGYHIARLEATTTHRDLVADRNIKGPYLVEKQWVDGVQFQRVGEALIPMAWQRSHSLRRLDDPQLHQWQKNRVRRTRVLLNPDHDALGSFKPAFIQDGWRIRVQGFGDGFEPAGLLLWKAGQIVNGAGTRIELTVRPDPEDD